MGEKVPSSQTSAWLAFLKNLASFRGDLSTLTAPPFLLSPQSITEFSAYWAEHPVLLVAPAKEIDPEKRALLVLRWFISTLQTQHSSRDENGEKKGLKPLNPFLGEVFKGTWLDEAGMTELVAEQVSHHPPATAFKLWNSQHGVSLHGHIAPKVYFSGTVHIDRKGYALLRVAEYDESYLITMPKVHVEGLITGSPTPELSGRSYIRSSSGYTMTIDYLGRKWLSGQSNRFIANLYCDTVGGGDESLYTAEGQWSSGYSVKSNRDGSQVMAFNIAQQKHTPLSVRPIVEQQPWESRRAWKDVIQGIHDGDILKVGSAKSHLENQQREMRKQEQLDGRSFEHRYFTPREPHSDTILAALIDGLPRDANITEEVGTAAGVWRWDTQRTQRSQTEEEEAARMERTNAFSRPRFDSAISGMEESDGADV